MRLHVTGSAGYIDSVLLAVLDARGRGLDTRVDLAAGIADLADRFNRLAAWASRADP